MLFAPLSPPWCLKMSTVRKVDSLFIPQSSTVIHTQGITTSGGKTTHRKKTSVSTTKRLHRVYSPAAPVSWGRPSDESNFQQVQLLLNGTFGFSCCLMIFQKPVSLFFKKNKKEWKKTLKGKSKTTILTKKCGHNKRKDQMWQRICERKENKYERTRVPEFLSLFHCQWLSKDLTSQLLTRVSSRPSNKPETTSGF